MTDNTKTKTDRNNIRSGELAEDRSRPTGAAREAERKERVPLYKQNAVTYFNQEPGYHYRLVNDVYGRIAKFLHAGWQIVEGSVDQTYSGTKQESVQSGAQIWRTVNKDPNAPSHKAVLMCIREEDFAADQAAKQALIDEEEAAYDPEGIIRQAQLMGGRASQAKTGLKTK